jgi:hypothetical protein
MGREIDSRQGYRVVEKMPHSAHTTQLIDGLGQKDRATKKLLEKKFQTRTTA